MDTILYFQSPSKTSTPDKIAGVRRHATVAGWHVQAIDGIPSPGVLARLVDFWHPIGAIVECGGGYDEIPVNQFKGLPTVYLDRNPRTLPANVSCVSHDSVATGRLAAKELRFRQAAGHSILDEIQSVRLARAKELLSNSTQDMSCIANFCGFKAANAFWKFFRQETGLSPTEWRMKNSLR